MKHRDDCLCDCAPPKPPKPPKYIPHPVPRPANNQVVAEYMRRTGPESVGEWRFMFYTRDPEVAYRYAMRVHKGQHGWAPQGAFRSEVRDVMRDGHSVLEVWISYTGQDW